MVYGLFGLLLARFSANNLHFGYSSLTKVTCKEHKTSISLAPLKLVTIHIYI